VENDSKTEKTDAMHNRHGLDMWSDGPDGEDDHGGDDDITNWAE